MIEIVDAIAVVVIAIVYTIDVIEVGNTYHIAANTLMHASAVSGLWHYGNIPLTSS